MSKKIILLLCILVAFAGFASAKTHRINRLGNPGTTFYRPPMKSVADLQKMVTAKKADIQKVLEMRGWKGNIDDLMSAVNSGKATETTIEPGAEIPFMANRHRGKPAVIEDLVWAGKKPFAAYQVEFDSNGYTYYFYFPKPCGNFWMEERTARKTEPVMGPSVGVTAQDVCVTQPVHVKVTTANAAADATVQFTLDGQTQSMPASAMTEKDLPAYTQPGPHTITVAMQGASPASATFNVNACPPVCSVTVAPPEIKRKKPFTVDASGSKVATGVTGNVKSASVEIDLAGAAVQNFDLTAPNLKKDDVKVKKAGAYTVKASVMDDLGQKSTNACEASFEVPKPKNPFFIGAFFGKERLFQNDSDFIGGRCAPEMGIKAGVLPEIADEVELELSVGGKIDFRDGNNSSIFADVAINKLVGRGFFGAGATFWDLTEKDTRAVGLLLQGGFDITQDGKYQFVGEVRAPFHKFNDSGITNANDISNNYQFWGGIRIRPWR